MLYAGCPCQGPRRAQFRANVVSSMVSAGVRYTEVFDSLCCCGRCKVDKVCAMGHVTRGRKRKGHRVRIGHKVGWGAACTGM